MESSRSPDDQSARAMTIASRSLLRCRASTRSELQCSAPHSRFTIPQHFQRSNSVSFSRAKSDHSAFSDRRSCLDQTTSIQELGCMTQASHHLIQQDQTQMMSTQSRKMQRCDSSCFNGTKACFQRSSFRHLTLTGDQSERTASWTNCSAARSHGRMDGESSSSHDSRQSRSPYQRRS